MNANYTVNEAAQTLKVKPNTVRRMLQRGQLVGAKVGKSWRIGESELQAAILGVLAGQGASTQSEIRVALTHSGPLPSPEQLRAYADQTSEQATQAKAWTVFWQMADEIPAPQNPLSSDAVAALLDEARDEDTIELVGDVR